MKGMQELKISIVIPVYNRPALVAECLDSVIAQTYHNWECVVVDDCSTDNTMDVLQSYSSKHERIRVYKRDRESKGAPTCRNIGMERAEGDYLMFFDCDDILLEHCFEYQLSIAKKNPNFDAWIFPVGMFKKQIGDFNVYWNQVKSDTDDLVRFLNQDMPWPISGPLWNLKRLHKSKWFDEEAKSYQDWEMHINKLLQNIVYFKCDGKDSITSYVRAGNVENKISCLNNTTEYMSNRALIISKIITKISGSECSNKVKIATKCLLLRQCNYLIKAGLKKEARSLWKTGRPLFSFFAFRNWYLYLQIKNVSFFTERIMEFVAYRVLRKHDVLNGKSTLLQIKIQ